MTIFLIGMPASGKTTIGRLLAEHLQYAYFDTDEIIASLEGLSVPEIFATKGETYFRQLESDLLSNWKMTHTVIATGGGLPCYMDNMDRLNQKGTTVWLKVSQPELVRRLLTEPNSRPLYALKNEKEMISLVQEMYKHRKNSYQKAQIRILCQHHSPEVIVKKIVRKLYQ